MPKVDVIEQSLNRLSALRRAESPESLVGELLPFLRSRSNLVVAKAATVTAQLRLSELIPDLLQAFSRFMADAARLDKRCAAITAIVTALYELDYTEPEPFLAGIKHVQLEASFGPRVDEAAKLRGTCAQALLRTRHPAALSEVLTLLVDKEPPARLGAVRALATNGGDAGVLLLRLKILTGDNDPEVLAECFAGLLAASADSAVKIVASYLDAEDAASAEAAILALGESRLPAALEALREKLQRTARRPEKKVVLIAIAASRLDEAIALLVSLVESEGIQTASDAIEALAIYRHNQRVSDSVREAVLRRGAALLREKFQQVFESGG